MIQWLNVLFLKVDWDKNVQTPAYQSWSKMPLFTHALSLCPYVIVTVDWALKINYLLISLSPPTPFFTLDLSHTSTHSLIQTWSKEKPLYTHSLSPLCNNHGWLGIKNQLPTDLPPPPPPPPPTSSFSISLTHPHTQLCVLHLRQATTDKMNWNPNVTWKLQQTLRNVSKQWTNRKSLSTNARQGASAGQTVLSFQNQKHYKHQTVDSVTLYQQHRKRSTSLHMTMSYGFFLTLHTNYKQYFP